MIQKYVRSLAILSCFQLMATDPTKVTLNDTSIDGLFNPFQKREMTSPPLDNDEVTSPVMTKIWDKVLYRQYPATHSKGAGTSGYDAAKNTLILAKSESLSLTKFGETIIQLTDPELEGLYNKEDSPWRTRVIAERQNTVAQDYIKDAMLLSIKGAKKFEFLLKFSRLFLEGKDMLFESVPDAEVLNALVGLVAGSVERLALQGVKKADAEFTYSISRDALFQAVQEEAANRAKSDARAVYKQLQQIETLKECMPELTGLEFTLTNAVNEISISGIDPMTGNPKVFKTTYGASDLPDLMPSEQTMNDLLSKSENPLADELGALANGLSSLTPSANPLHTEQMNGDWLSGSDLTKLIKEVKGNDLANISVHCLDSSKKASMVQEIILELECGRIISQLESSADQAFAITPINCDGHWIACLVSKKYGELGLVVADSQNKDRRHDLAVQKLAAAIDESIKKKQPKEESKVKADAQEHASTTAASSNDEKDKDKPENETYEAPLAHFSLDELPTLDELFGGKTPNEALVRLAQLKAIAREETIAPGKAKVTSIKNCLLLYGPPGTGKSTIAQVLARLPKDEDGNEAFELVFTNAARFRTAFQGSTNESMKRLLKAATSKKKPCIVIIDEIDGTTAKLEPHNSTQEDSRANKALIDILDLVRHNRRIFFIATSNYPEKMDPAVLRRFTALEIPLPTYTGRKTILENYFKKNGIACNGENDSAVSPAFFEALVRATKGFSGAELEDLVANASLVNQLQLPPEKSVGMGFWLNSIDTSRSLFANLSGLLENPCVPLFYWLGGYTNTTFDKHLYHHYQRLQKVRLDIEEKEHANDPNSKALKQPWRQKVKAAFVSAITSAWHGLFSQVGSDTYTNRIKPPMVDLWKKVTAPAA